MSSFDEALFTRDGWTGLSLSQRFTSNVHKFYGTFKVAIEMLLTNTILGSLPRSLGCFLLFFYITAGLALFFLIAKSLWNRHQGINYEDLDLVDVATSNNMMKGVLIAIVLALLYFLIYYVTSQRKTFEEIYKEFSIAVRNSY